MTAHRGSVSALQIAVAALAALLLMVFAWLVLAHDLSGGQPRVVAKIQKSDPMATGSVRSSTGPSSLRKAPLSLLLEPGRYGALPRISGDETPLSAYSRPISAEAMASPLPKVALIIGGVGGNDEMSAAAIERLPEEVTLAIDSNGRNLQSWVDRARLSGHEVLLQLPMEALAHPNAGPGARTLLASMSPAEIQDDLHWHLARAAGYFGVINQLGGKFLGSEAALEPLAHELKRRGLLFVEDMPSGQSKAAAVADDVDMKYLGADIVIDEDSDPAAIDAALEELLNIAERKGFALAVGSAFPATLERVELWTKRAMVTKRVMIVPASAALVLEPQ
ncbi:hypothetical protein FHS85_000063 [Rhodoligotrophos appendicifer]|uniref:divergent polysaccharide deacetylase family protein n=1 Tax=Rhodoligotrophos appendicifer TaxID=987056 RepID=UPI0014790049|nr:divergent polysaccharide deacetylase family protein [Rhodoligotrophos appendicifer]